MAIFSQKEEAAILNYAFYNSLVEFRYKEMKKSHL